MDEIDLDCHSEWARENSVILVAGTQMQSGGCKAGNPQGDPALKANYRDGWMRELKGKGPTARVRSVACYQKHPDT